MQISLSDNSSLYHQHHQQRRLVTSFSGDSVIYFFRFWFAWNSINNKINFYFASYVVRLRLRFKYDNWWGNRTLTDFNLEAHILVIESATFNLTFSIVWENLNYSVFITFNYLLTLRKNPKRIFCQCWNCAIQFLLEVFIGCCSRKKWFHPYSLNFIVVRLLDDLCDQCYFM